LASSDARKRLARHEDDDEEPTVDWILDKARGAVLRHGVNGVVIDPYNEIEHRRPANMTETEYISQSLAKQKRFAVNHGVHFFEVAHPVKLPREDGKYPPPTLYDISGSANWANKADVGLTVHRPDKDTMAIARKSKPSGQPNEAVIQRLINKGGSVAAAKFAHDEAALSSILLRIPSDMLARIDAAVQRRRPVRISRQAWTIEQLQNALDRERRGDE
jgi:hypothetical protein